MQPSDAMVAAVEASFHDSCTISAPTVATYDAEGNELTDVDGDLVYDGPCSLAEVGGSGAEAFQLRGGELESRRFYLLSIPRTAPAPAPGHQVVMYATVDPSLANQILAVRKTRFGTRMTRRLLLCEMIQVARQ